MEVWSLNLEVTNPSYIKYLLEFTTDKQEVSAQTLLPKKVDL
jgi:hypothetical protein